MATFKDLKLILSMGVDQFFAAAAAVNQEHEKLKKEVEEPVKIKIGDEIKADLKDVKAAAKKTEKDIENSPVDFNVRFQGAFRKAWEEYDGTRKRIRKNPIRVQAVGIDEILQKLALFGVAFAGISGSVTAFREFETSLANVASLGVTNIEELKKQVIEIGLETPVAINDLTAGLYDVVSAGVDSANQIQVLEASAKAAKAGLAQTSDALNLGSAVIKGYGKNFSEFEGVMDQAFQTVKLGQTTFPALAASAGQVIPSFSALKINTNELFGAFATLTGVTGSTAEVSTQLKAISEGLLKPTKELNTLIKSQTGLTVEQFTAQKGLAGVLEIVKEATQGSATEAGKLFSSSEALTAILSLTSAQFDDFAKKSSAMANASGAANAAFEVQAQTLDAQLQILENRFNVVTSAILTGAVPAIGGLVDGIAGALEWFARLDEGNRNAIIAIAGLTAVLLKGKAALLAMRAAVIALNASLGPVGLLVTVLGAAAVALVGFKDAAEKADERNKLLAASSANVATSLKEIEATALKAARALTFEQLTEKRSELEATLESLKQKLVDLQNAPAKSFTGALELRQVEETKQLIEETKSNIKAVDDALTESTAKREAEAAASAEKQRQEAAALTAAELRQLDERKKFEFDTNRITLAQYVAYLNSRRAALAASLGAENIEFLKFTDDLKKLTDKLATEQEAKTLKLSLEQEGDLEAREIDTSPQQRLIEVETEFSETRLENLEKEYGERVLIAEENLRLIAEKYGADADAYRAALSQKLELDRNYNAARDALNQQLFEVDTQFSETTMENLQVEYDQRSFLLQDNLRKIEEIYGADTEAYRAELAKRKALDASYAAARQQLQIAGFKTALDLGSKMVNAFQGQSKTLFGVGKALAIANTTINTIEAVSRAFKDYPFPANIAIAAIQLGLGTAQIAKVQSVNFKPPGGKAAGGLVTGADFLAAALPVPSGEDGYIAVQQGEMVVNRRATQAFFPVLNQLNRLYASGSAPSSSAVPSFQDGGRVETVIAPSPAGENAPAGINLSDEKADELIDAIRDIQIVLRQDTDAVKWLRENFPAYDKLQKARRL